MSITSSESSIFEKNVTFSLITLNRLHGGWVILDSTDFFFHMGWESSYHTHYLFMSKTSMYTKTCSLQLNKDLFTNPKRTNETLNSNHLEFSDKMFNFDHHLSSSYSHMDFPEADNKPYCESWWGVKWQSPCGWNLDFERIFLPSRLFANWASQQLVGGAFVGLL